MTSPNPFGRRHPPPGTRRARGTRTNPLATTEAEFQTSVIDLAKLFRWRICHFRPALTEHGWRTPIEGDPGFPDLALARQGVLWVRELKTDDETRSKLTPDQWDWLDAAGINGGVWRPRDLRSGRIRHELASSTVVTQGAPR